MPFFDMPIEQLREYKPDVHEPVDFDRFWLRTLEENVPADQPISIRPAAEHLTNVEVFDLVIRGYGGDPVSAWYIRPKGAKTDLPMVVSFVGYGGGRGFPEEHLTWPSAGIAELVVDSRGQGASWSAGGSTADRGIFDPSVPGVMTKGVLDPENYYYRRIYTDAANAVHTARNLPGVDSERVVTAGGSQGAGLAIAAAALDTIRNGGRRSPIGVVAGQPFLSDFPRAVGLTGAYPYQEVVDYLNTMRDQVDAVFHTLSYFDGVNLAKRITSRALYSVALMDEITPPSTVFASYNWFGGTAEIEIYPYNGHEGGGPYQTRLEVEWVQNLVNKVR